MMIKVSIVDLTDVGTRVDLYTECLRLRRNVFISSMGWNLYESLGCEFDQYDTPASIHLAATIQGRVVGCMRLLRTDSNHGGVTYMILDAHRGRIPNLPSGILYEELVSPLVWEGSRLAISTDVASVDRNRILVALVDAGRNYIVSRKGTSMLGLMNPVFQRVFARSGFRVRRFGDVSEQRDGRICVLRWDFAPSKQLETSLQAAS